MLRSCASSVNKTLELLSALAHFRPPKHTEQSGQTKTDKDMIVHVLGKQSVICWEGFCPLLTVLAIPLDINLEASTFL